MLERLDRVQVAAGDLDAGSKPFEEYLGATIVRDDAVDCLGASRRVLHAGRSAIEILAPSGPGAISDFRDSCGDGLFGAGFSTHNIAGLKAHLADRGTPFTEERGQLFLSGDATGNHGMPVVITPAIQEELGPAGLIRSIYEVTNIVDDHSSAAAEYAQMFSLDAAQFHPIKSDVFGYVGTLTLFRPSDRLDRIEVVTTTDDEKTMGRFGAKRGESLYMFFAESDDIDSIRERLRAGADGNWSENPNRDGDVIFIHPKAMAGVLVGISRTTVGWLWSGSPERVEKRSK